MLDYLELRSQVILVDDLDLLGLSMPQEASSVFKEVDWGYADLWNQAFSLNWHCEHVLTNTFQVNYQDHVVDLWETGDEFYGYLGLLVLLELSSFILYDKLRLGGAPITRHTHDVVDVDLRRVCQVDSLLLCELVGDFAEIYGVL